MVLSEYKHSGYHKMSWKYNKLLLKYINYYLRNKLKKKYVQTNFRGENMTDSACSDSDEFMRKCSKYMQCR